MIYQAVFCYFASKSIQKSSNVGCFLVKLELMNLYTWLKVIDGDGKTAVLVVDIFYCQFSVFPINRAF